MPAWQRPCPNRSSICANEYYSSVDEENEQLLRFFAWVYARLDPVETMLELGGGPTISTCSSLRHAVIEHIHVAEYLPANREEICMWISNSPDAFDWNAFIRRTLQIERALRRCPYPVRSLDVRGRRHLVRSRIVAVIPCDVTSDIPLPPTFPSSYQTSQHELRRRVDLQLGWLNGSASCVPLRGWVSPGGTPIMTALIGAHHYTIGAADDSLQHASVRPISNPN